MSHDYQAQEQTKPTLHYGSEYPNFPEVSGTSLPLLTTVLAGFAVTIIVQLLVRPDATEDLPRRVVIALLAFLLSTLFFLCSTVFAINAQANNYLPFLDLSEASTRLLNVDNVSDWIWTIGRRWYIYHLATIFSFYAGVVLLLAGINLIVWVFVGTTVALIFLVAVLVSVGTIVGMGLLADRLSKRVPQEHMRDEGKQHD